MNRKMAKAENPVKESLGKHTARGLDGQQWGRPPDDKVWVWEDQRLCLEIQENGRQRTPLPMSQRLYGLEQQPGIEPLQGPFFRKTTAHNHEDPWVKILGEGTGTLAQGLVFTSSTGTRYTASVSCHPFFHSSLGDQIEHYLELPPCCQVMRSRPVKALTQSCKHVITHGQVLHTLCVFLWYI